MSDTIQRFVPMLCYDDAPGAIQFLTQAFGFEETYRFDMPDGHVGYAELSYRGQRISLATTWKAAGMASPRDLDGVHSQVVCNVDDVDAHFEQARAAGATVISTPRDQDHGARSYRAVDSEGHRWIFSTPTSE